MQNHHVDQQKARKQNLKRHKQVHITTQSVIEVSVRFCINHRILGQQNSQN